MVTSAVGPLLGTTLGMVLVRTLGIILKLGTVLGKKLVQKLSTSEYEKFFDVTISSPFIVIEYVPQSVIGQMVVEKSSPGHRPSPHESSILHV
mmetsp:Transcript_7773/g.18759  ORF Transcript_7773/g.18759 Transcript_7773/m.18759 type:complete len:93 (+) Transcript_7773:125-403(+)